MKQYLDTPAVNAMREEIMDRYGPSIHNELVNDMSVDRISRIYINMKLLEERSCTKRDCIKGQLSLFDKE